MVSHGVCKFGDLCAFEHDVPILGPVGQDDHLSHQHSVLLEENSQLRINISRIVMSIEAMSSEIDKLKARVFELEHEHEDYVQSNDDSDETTELNIDDENYFSD